MFGIAIMGCGVVGSGVADILIEQKDSLSRKLGAEVTLKKIVDVRDMPGTPYEKYLTKNADDIFSDPDIKLLVMTVGGLDFAYQMTEKALEKGLHVVTSNKEVVAAYNRELTKTAFDHNVRFLYEASSGGGIPIIRPLNICLSGNEITEIQGILNGTTNYILTQMESEGVSFAEALKDAQSKGYAEANPAADVDGFDAARKIAILSSIAYKQFVAFEDVECRGIRDITIEDIKFAETINAAIKLIARSTFNKDTGSVSVSVAPYMIPKEGNLIANVSSVYNAVLVKGSYTGDTLFYGKGAGKLATASAVVGDIVEIIQNPKETSLPDFTSVNARIDNSAKTFCRRYVRIKSTDKANAENIIESLFNAKLTVIGTHIYGFVTEAVSSDDFDKALITLKSDFEEVSTMDIID